MSKRLVPHSLLSKSSSGFVLVVLVALGVAVLWNVSKDQKPSMTQITETKQEATITTQDDKGRQYKNEQLGITFNLPDTYGVVERRDAQRNILAIAKKTDIAAQQKNPKYENGVSEAIVMSVQSSAPNYQSDEFESVESKTVEISGTTFTEYRRTQKMTNPYGNEGDVLIALIGQRKDGKYLVITTFNPALHPGVSERVLQSVQFDTPK